MQRILNLLVIELWVFTVIMVNFVKSLTSSATKCLLPSYSAVLKSGVGLGVSPLILK